MEKKQKIYFGRTSHIHGTATEKKLIKIMTDAGLEVFDPYVSIGNEKSIKPYLDAIDTCDAFICYPHNGFVTKGLYDELKHAIKKDMPCHRIIATRDGSLSLVTIEGVRMYEPDPTHIKYGKIIY